MILSKMGMKTRMRAALITCIWSGRIWMLPNLPSILVAWKVHLEP